MPCLARWPEAANRSSTLQGRASSARARKGSGPTRSLTRDTPITPIPARAARVALNERILSYRDKGCRPVIICPSLIYGLGLGVDPHSTQVPWLIELARKRGGAVHAGPGENIWSNVHVDDLVTLYALAIEKAPAGAFFFAENGENSMREVCEAINRMLGFAKAPSAMSMEEAAAEWGEGAAEYTMASNSRVRAVRARELGWKPQARGLDRGDRAGVLPVARQPTASSSRPSAQLRTGAGTHTPRLIVSNRCSTTSRNDERWWLWVPAFAGTTLLPRNYCFTPSHHAHVPDIS